MTEREIQKQVHRVLGSRDDCRLFRNTCGYITTDTRHIRYGLTPGSSDLIGWKTVTITPEMVGCRIAIFLAVEVKTPKGRVTKQQQNFIDVVRRMGGIAEVVRSAEEVDKLLK